MILCTCDFPISHAQYVAQFKSKNLKHQVVCSVSLHPVDIAYFDFRNVFDSVAQAIDVQCK